MTYSSKPRVELDSDVVERYQDAAQKHGLPLTTLVNFVLRSVEFVEVKTIVNPKSSPVSKTLKIRSGRWRVRL